MHIRVYMCISVSWCANENHSLVDPLSLLQELPQIAPEFLFAMSGQLQSVQQVMEEAERPEFGWKGRVTGLMAHVHQGTIEAAINLHKQEQKRVPKWYSGAAWWGNSLFHGKLSTKDIFEKEGCGRWSRLGTIPKW